MCKLELNLWQIDKLVDFIYLKKTKPKVFPSGCMQNDNGGF